MYVKIYDKMTSSECQKGRCYATYRVEHICTCCEKRVVKLVVQMHEKREEHHRIVGKKKGG